MLIYLFADVVAATKSIIPTAKLDNFSFNVNNLHNMEQLLLMEWIIWDDDHFQMSRVNYSIYDKYNGVWAYVHIVFSVSSTAFV